MAVVIDALRIERRDVPLAVQRQISNPSVRGSASHRSGRHDPFRTHRVLLSCERRAASRLEYDHGFFAQTQRSQGC